MREQWTEEKLFGRLINNKLHKTYWDYISILRKRPNEFTFRRCTELIKSGNPKKREIGIDILAQLGTTPRPYYKETIKLFFEALESEKDPKVLRSLLYGIGHNNDLLNKAQIEKLCSFKETANELIKEGLVFSLLGIDEAIAIDVLIQFSRDKLGRIRNWATFGIGEQTSRDNKKIREALWKRINDRNLEARAEAILGLVKRKDARIKDVIMKSLMKGNYRGLLFDAIIELNDKEMLPILKKQFELEKENDQINPDWLNAMQHCINQLSKS